MIPETKRSVISLKYLPELKKAELNLNAPHPPVHDLIDLHPDATFAIDKDKKVIAWNRALEEMTGVRKADIIGKGDFAYAIALFGVKKPLLVDMIFLRDEEIKSRYESVERKGNVISGEEWISSLYGGQETYFGGVASPLYDNEGNLVGAIESIRDITARKRAEKKQLELIKDLECANKGLMDFASIVSHDLKTPLHSINMLARWITTDYSDKLDETGKERLDLIINRVLRMNRLIEDILRYSRIGHFEEEKEEVNLNTIVSEMIDMIDPPGDMEIELANQLPSIVCEKTRIEQVFQNLLSNAVRYMDKPEGKVTIGCTEEDGYWKFSVADNGPGIDEKYHERIFQIFQTLKPRDAVESTGVGLTIVKKIVKSKGGKIWVESKVGEGSTFFFTIPKTNGKEA